MIIQSRIQSARPQLSPSMRRVGDAVLADPRRVLNGSISDLAAAASTSETTVVRFCHRLGLAGYADLRLGLAGELATEQARRRDLGQSHGEDLPTSNGLDDVVTEIASAEMAGIEETATALDRDILHHVVAAVAAANQVIMHGLGASSSVAGDLERKLQRIGRVARAMTDTHDAIAVAALMTSSQVALGVSHSGVTEEVAAFLERARRAGATTVAITNSRSGPVVSAADLVLRTTVRESAYRSGAMASRSAQLLVVDCVFVALAQMSRDETVRALGTTYESIEDYRRR